ncbi:T-lymphocyte activation antigen CD80 isoform X2 [Cololabis saira]|uniref:T-lymphocyte activation antigen CD80 isoform X2 n=1 Tax=Cololabis saira TaxID=129043 RepID=UPI002AD30C8B|nr:T-lymphocyte activation antigen CD80 isoform X2 [Cololabis saira]
MASIGLVCFTVLICSFPSAAVSDFISVDCHEATVGQLDRPSVLTCVITWEEGITDVVVRRVKWQKKGEDVPLLHYGEPMISRPGYSFAVNPWTNRTMNVSLLISRTTVADDGDYTCDVASDSGVSQGRTALRVTAKYSQPTVESIHQGATLKALHCVSVGGYPAGELRWFDAERYDWTGSATTEMTKMDNGLFNLSSTLALSEKSTFPKYICAVFNSSRRKEAEVIWEKVEELPDHDRSTMIQSSKVVAPLVVIGSLIVGLLALLVYRRRIHRPRNVPTEDPDVEEGVPEEEEEEEKDNKGEGRMV